MTEEEANKDPELLSIIPISKYAKELVESRDYFKASSNLVKSISEIYKKHQKESERQLLIDFFIFFRNKGEENIGMTIEELVDKFLNQNTK